MVMVRPMITMVLSNMTLNLQRYFPTGGNAYFAEGYNQWNFTILVIYLVKQKVSGLEIQKM